MIFSNDELHIVLKRGNLVLWEHFIFLYFKTSPTNINKKEFSMSHLKDVCPNCLSKLIIIIKKQIYWLLNDIKFAVEKNHLGVQILYRISNPVKNGVITVFKFSTMPISQARGNLEKKCIFRDTL